MLGKGPHVATPIYIVNHVFQLEHLHVYRWNTLAAMCKQSNQSNHDEL